MKNDLRGKRVAILATDGFEQSELEKPLEAVKKSGADADVVSPKSGKIQGWKNDDFGNFIAVDVTLENAKAEDYDALILPGGVMNPDKLRQLPEAVQFVRDFFVAGKPVAAICHGPQLLIEADVVRGRRLTSYSSIRKDLENAGAEWVDEPVVTDQGLVTSRNPGDIPAFNKKVLEEIAEGVHFGQTKSLAAN